MIAQSSDAAFPPDLPFPGDDLVFRVAGTTDRTWFFHSGRQSVADIDAVLATVGRRLRDHDRVLDFGCGCGRVLLWLRQVAEKAELYGVDVDAPAIEWVRATLDYVKFQVNNPLPPLDFPDGFFDFAYCHSVFTHIDEFYQDEWLAELRRVARPGALLLISVHGEHPFRQMEETRRSSGLDASSFRRARDDRGLRCATDDRPDGIFPDFYHTTYHTPQYVFGHWGRYFRIRAYVPQGSLGHQDFVLLERTDDASPVSEQLPSGEQAAAAVSHVVALTAMVKRGPRFDYPTRFGGVSTIARRLMLRILRHYAGYQRDVD